jgi:hypothetical protein
MSPFKCILSIERDDSSTTKHALESADVIRKLQQKNPMNRGNYNTYTQSKMKK